VKKQFQLALALVLAAGALVGSATRAMAVCPDNKNTHEVLALKSGLTTTGAKTDIIWTTSQQIVINSGHSRTGVMF